MPFACFRSLQHSRQCFIQADAGESVLCVESESRFGMIHWSTGRRYEKTLFRTHAITGPYAVVILFKSFKPVFAGLKRGLQCGLALRAALY